MRFLTLLLFCLMIIEPTVMKKNDETPGDIIAVRRFIMANWKNVIRFNPVNKGTLIGLPKPYTVPTISGMFQCMYYWDTYFTNIGLIIDGQVIQAKNNVDDMVYLVEEYGFMPNGNQTFYLSRTQPPYLSMMVRDVYVQTHDKAWLKKVLPVLEKEYRFWMTERITPIGLNHYAPKGDNAAKMSIYNLLHDRLGERFDTSELNKKPDKAAVGAQFLAECESGWDFTPRFNSRCMDYCPVDLNCNLYMYEKNFVFFYSELHLPGAQTWESSAQKRDQLIHQYCQSPADQLFYDYDYTTHLRSEILSAANFNTMWSGLATKSDASNILRCLSKLEFAHGIAACSPGPRKFNYQWDYPNAWANLQYLAIAGLNKYNYNQDARRIAGKYTAMVATNFKKTGNLWEKYNVVDGSTNVNNEYKMPSMMGWTAGVFNYAAEQLH